MKLVLSVLSARNLPDIETIGKVDPFFCVYLNGETVFTSTVVPECNNPAWTNEGVELDVSTSPEVVVAVFNENTTVNDEFGRFTVDLNGLNQGESVEWVNLASEEYHCDAQVRFDAVDFGKVDASGRSSEQGRGRRLAAKVTKVTNLPDTDTFGASDCYVVLTWCGSRFKTATVQDSQHPTWVDATAELMGDTSEAIEVEVWDEDPGGDESVGIGALPLDGLHKGVASQHRVRLSHPDGYSPVVHIDVTPIDFGSSPPKPTKPKQELDIAVRSVSAKVNGNVHISALHGRQSETIVEGVVRDGRASFTANTTKVSRGTSLKVAIDDSEPIIVKLRPHTEKLVRGEETECSIKFGGGHLTVALTATDFGIEKKPREPVDIVFDRAFEQACNNCGIALGDLKPKQQSDFKSEGDSIDVAAHRYETHQNTLVKRLHTVVTERQRILAEAAKMKPSSYDNSATSSQAGDGQDGRMVERAKRQRAFWDKNNERLLAAQRLREERLANAEEEAVKRAEAEREKQEEHQSQMIALHRANQKQMQRRFARDEELAELRQRQIDEMTAKRSAAWEEHQAALKAARERRNQTLASAAGSGDDGNTQARLEKAKALRKQVDDEIAERTKGTLAEVDKRREQHAMKEFLKQVDLANKALKEREIIELHLQRSSQTLDEHLAKSSARIDELDARYKARKAKQSQSAGESASRAATAREERHARAKNARVSSVQHREAQRRKNEEKRQMLEDERLERLHDEEDKKRAAADARQEHQREVMKRVTQQSEEQQRARATKLTQQQEAAEARMKHLSEIRAMLK